MNGETLMGVQKRGWRLFAAAIAVLAWTGVGQAQQNSDWDKVVAAAKQEGKLVFYNGTTVVVPPRIAQMFQQRYGIQVDVLNARAGEVRERIRSEQASGKHIADVTLNGIATATTQKSWGTFQPHGPLPNLSKLVPPFHDDGELVPLRAGRFGILINTDLVKPQDEPKSWQDVLDPKWRGKLLLDDPRNGSGGYVLFAVTLDKLGRGYQEKLAAQKPVLSTESSVSQRRVARGEFPMFLPFTLADMRNLIGLPVKAIVPEEGAPYITGVMAMLKDAPHPNAARLFIDYS